MKNMIEICKDFGIEIPADKHAEFNKAVAENYKTVAEQDGNMDFACIVSIIVVICYYQSYSM